MNSDNVALISLILAVVALLAPVITTIVNNKQNSKMKELEFKQQKYQADTLNIKKKFSLFLESYGNLTAYPDKNNLQEFNKSFFSVLPYIPTQYAEIFNEFYENVSEGRSRRDFYFEKMVNDIIPAIQNILKEL